MLKAASIHLLSSEVMTWLSYPRRPIRRCAGDVLAREVKRHIENFVLMTGQSSDTFSGSRIPDLREMKKCRLRITMQTLVWQGTSYICQRPISCTLTDLSIEPVTMKEQSQLN